MDKSTTRLAHSSDDAALPAQTESNTARFERPSIEEVSLCCEISAYAPDGDDRPLF
jgi:hypothetical protein